MPTEEELINERKRKREDLLNKQINPYPYNYNPTHKSTELLEKHKGLEPGEKTNEEVRIAGRIIGLRRMGKASFIHLLDQEGKIQAYLKFDDLKEQYENLKLADIGDWL